MPKPSQHVSLKDIAQSLGVSYSIVSKVLSGRMGTSSARPELVEAIHKKAQELDYRPNPLASALQSGRQGTVGVLIHPSGEAGTEITLNLLNGISDSLAEHSLRVWMRFYKNGSEFTRNIGKYASREMDGMIVMGYAHKETFDLISKIHGEGLPVVSIFEYQNIQGIPNVSPDLTQQGFIATEHLIAQGCKRICHLKTDSVSIKQGLQEQMSRSKGYYSALAQYDIPIDPALVFEANDYKIETGANAVKHWLKNKIPFDGIVAQSDHQAIGAIHELIRNGIKVPEQVRVIGTDDSPLCLASPVPLSSIGAGWREVGHHASNMIVSEIDTKKSSPSLTIGPRLVIRESSL